MITVTATEAKNSLLELLRGVSERGETVRITRNGIPSGVLVSAEEWESLVETISILSDAAAMRKIGRARRELESGIVLTHDQVWGKHAVPTALSSRRRARHSRSSSGGRTAGATRTRKAR